MRSSAGDQAFETWYTQVHPQLAASLVVSFGDLDLAREAADEALVRAYERWGRVSKMQSPGGWAYRVAFNVARRRRRRRVFELRVTARTEPPRPVPGPAGELWELVGSLPERQRMAVALRHVGQLSEQEVGTAMGITESDEIDDLGRLVMRRAVDGYLVEVVWPPLAQEDEALGSEPPPELPGSILSDGSGADIVLETELVQDLTGQPIPSSGQPQVALLRVPAGTPTLAGSHEECGLFTLRLSVDDELVGQASFSFAAAIDGGDPDALPLDFVDIGPIVIDRRSVDAVPPSIRCGDGSASPPDIGPTSGGAAPGSFERPIDALRAFWQRPEASGFQRSGLTEFTIDNDTMAYGVPFDDGSGRWVTVIALERGPEGWSVIGWTSAGC